MMSSIAGDPLRRGAGTLLLGLSGRLLVAVAWTSAALFGAYVLAFYVAAIGDGDMQRWNQTLPGLYAPETPLALIGMGAHFLTGALLLLAGPVQLMAGIRRRFPAFHRWTGRAYVLAAFVTGIGGLAFILVRGTVGGWPMDVGFGLYGVLVTLAAVETFRHARTRRLDRHRAWAIRLFALVVGSWLYRMDYGIWLMLMGRLGHSNDFTGPFDIVMAFFFYLPNLMVAEVFIRARGLMVPGGVRLLAAAGLAATAALLTIGTYYFTKFYWGPPILATLGL
ncbi:DUF2306 domain-containing protein [Niveispirillum fermenti]|uniref:DUF2306 domain-containing protein n=1 Tax=Niveispirillum fermenti TaxID=1233113 RepID=UPI003A877EA0